MSQPTGAPYVSMFLLLKIVLYNFFSLGCYCTIINDQLFVVHLPLLMSDLIKRTFPLRRQTILEKPMNLVSMFERFPFLQDIDQIYALYELIFSCY